MLTLFQENKSPCELFSDFAYFRSWARSTGCPGAKRTRSVSSAKLALHSKGDFFASEWGLDQTLARRKTTALKCSQSGMVSYLHRGVLHNSGQMGEMGFV